MTHDEAIKNFTDNMRKISELFNISYVDMARACGLTRVYFYNFIYKSNCPLTTLRLNTLFDVAEALCVEPFWLLEKHSNREILQEVRLNVNKDEGSGDN